jgi:hypothetical protein
MRLHQVGRGAQRQGTYGSRGAGGGCRCLAPNGAALRMLDDFFHQPIRQKRRMFQKLTMASFENTAPAFVPNTTRPWALHVFKAVL